MNNREQDIVDKLKNQGLRLTSERRALIQLVLNFKGHFNAEKLLRRAQDQKLRISRATVYRLLPLLKEIGVLQTSLVFEGQTHFELAWEKDHHDHLVCSKCNKVVEFQNGEIEKLQHQIAKQYGFTLENHVMELHGVCKNCRH
jgi:Fur family ferric uptake transcriptional regulator